MDTGTGFVAGLHYLAETAIENAKRSNCAMNGEAERHVEMVTNTTD